MFGDLWFKPLRKKSRNWSILGFFLLLFDRFGWLVGNLGCKRVYWLSRFNLNPSLPSTSSSSIVSLWKFAVDAARASEKGKDELLRCLVRNHCRCFLLEKKWDILSSWSWGYGESLLAVKRELLGMNSLLMVETS